ncbi:iron complex transport system permease protein [Dendrosporobacter quercicolus]|uniref:Iron complex transport system permease protein n=1 Tax=Dendrosporobacter quercicolus TaxID=146817 RepID=A0A1G9YC78_9FIRM|nr:iron chelate uptake ABC transporter family permease subunit [Dendrosporobacter quercicolus]SDN06647.1 iron complex transport system permease protein [Dendrosporobacter quercicolus]
MNKQFFMARPLMILMLLLLSALSVLIGVKDIDFLQLGSRDVYIILISRLPRLISIIVAGSSIGITGLIMQTITKNKFVSPTTAGTVQWTRLGILVAILFFGGESHFTKMSVAFAFSLFGSFLFIGLLSRIKVKNAVLIPLIGLMLGSVVSAITTYFAYHYDLVQNMSSWLQGDFSLITKGRYELLYLGIPFLIIGYLFADKFTIAGMGGDFARNLGLKYEQVVAVGLVIVSMITAVVTVTVGALPFLDLIVPNIVSMAKGDNLKNSLLDTALIGTNFVLACDILGRVLLFPYEIPIGMIVSVSGSAIFLWMIFRRSQHAV